MALLNAARCFTHSSLIRGSVQLPCRKKSAERQYVASRKRAFLAETGCLHESTELAIPWTRLAALENCWYQLSKSAGRIWPAASSTSLTSAPW